MNNLQLKYPDKHKRTIAIWGFVVLLGMMFHLVWTESAMAESGGNDLNGDRRTDLLWRNTKTGSTAIWLLNGATIASAGFPGGVPLAWQIAGIGDVNGDGKADVIWRHSTSATVAIWLMNGTTITSVGFPASVPTAWSLQAVGDLNGDDKADLVWRNSNDGNTAIWLMNGSKIATSGFLGKVSVTWQFAGVGDVNGDSKADLIWRNGTSNAVAIWLMNGLTTTSSGFPGNVSPNVQIAGVGDVNGDGKADLLWRNTSNEDVEVWLLNGTTIASSGILDKLPSQWHIVQVGDADGDGKADVIWRDTNTGTVVVWLLNGLSVSSDGSPGTTSTDWIIAGRPNLPAPPAPLPLTITTTSTLPDGTAGQAYNVSLRATGGTPPLTWRLVSGALPPGVTLNPSTGQLSGIPTTSKFFLAIIGVQDGSNPPQSTQKGFSLAINSPPPGGGISMNIPISTSEKDETNPQIISDSQGGSIIIWHWDSDIYAQRINSAGVPLWGVNGIPITRAENFQKNSQAIPDDEGGAIIVWEDRRSGKSTEEDIYAQRVSSTGEILWTPNGAPISTAVSLQRDPRLTSDGAGGAIVVWETAQRTSATVVYPDIFAQRVNSSGIVQWPIDGVPIATNPSFGNHDPSIVSDGSGGAIIGWKHDEIQFRSVFLQRIDSSGIPQWNTNGIDISQIRRSGSCNKPKGGSPLLTSDQQGGAIVVWIGFVDCLNADFQQRVDSTVIRAQRVNDRGEELWENSGVIINLANESQKELSIAPDGANGAILVWSAMRNGANFDVFTQRVDDAGLPQWAPDGIPVGTGIGNQDSPQLTPDGAGGAIIVWQDKRLITEYDLYAQRLNSAGIEQWSANGVPVSTARFDQLMPVLTTDGAGGAIMAWQDQRNNSFGGPFAGRDIYAQHVSHAGVLQ